MSLETGILVTGCACLAAEQADAFKSEFAIGLLFALLFSRQRLASAHLARKAQKDLDSEHIFDSVSLQVGSGAVYN